MLVLIRIQGAFTSLPLRSEGNFDGICVFLHGYELFWTGLCSFELVTGGLGGGGQSTTVIYLYIYIYIYNSYINISIRT